MYTVQLNNSGRCDLPYVPELTMVAVYCPVLPCTARHLASWNLCV